MIGYDAGMSSAVLILAVSVGFDPIMVELSYKDAVKLAPNYRTLISQGPDAGKFLEVGASSAGFLGFAECHHVRKGKPLHNGHPTVWIEALEDWNVFATLAARKGIGLVSLRRYKS